MTRIPLLRIPSVESATAVVEEFLATGRRPDWRRVAEDTGYEVDLDLVRQLLRQAMDTHTRRDVDAFVAPRLHFALRLPRRLAADRGVWAYLAVECDDFIRFRFDPAARDVLAGDDQPDDGDDAEVANWRYSGETLRNGLARLWWGAELVRNGPDYSAVPLVFRSVKTAEYALELVYSWHRPAAIAFTRVATGADGGSALGEVDMRELSKRLRVLLALRAAEAAGLEGDEPIPVEFDEDWAHHRPAWADVRTPDVTALEGPSTGAAAPEAVDELTAWFRRVADGMAAEGNAAPATRRGRRGAAATGIEASAEAAGAPLADLDGPEVAA